MKNNFFWPVAAVLFLTVLAFDEFWVIRAAEEETVQESVEAVDKKVVEESGSGVSSVG